MCHDTIWAFPECMHFSQKYAVRALCNTSDACTTGNELQHKSLPRVVVEKYVPFWYTRRLVKTLDRQYPNPQTRGNGFCPECKTGAESPYTGYQELALVVRMPPFICPPKEPLVNTYFNRPIIHEFADPINYIEDDKKTKHSMVAKPPSSITSASELGVWQPGGQDFEDTTMEEWYAAPVSSSDDRYINALFERLSAGNRDAANGVSGKGEGERGNLALWTSD